MTTAIYAFPSVAVAGRLYALRPRFEDLLAIEDELGSVPALCARLGAGTWQVGEVVSAVHILLAAAGATPDYMALGEEMRRHGIAAYAAALHRALGHVLGNDKNDTDRRVA